MQAGVATDVWKQNISDYMQAAEALYRSMERHGFDREHAIPIDQNGELFNGSHRVACALALEIEQVPVITLAGACWAPPWDADWFRSHGMSEQEIEDLQDFLEWLRPE